MAVSGAPNPSIKSVDDIKSRLLQPALTSNYECYFHIPDTFKSLSQGTAKDFIGKVVPVTSELTNLLTLSCSEASLPGSSLATHELNNDFTGVTQRHAYRRLYDNVADFTFYVNRGYTQIRLFERWMQFIAGEEQSTAPNLNTFYRVKYPKAYKTTIYITKFERDINKISSSSNLVYSFYNAFPTAIISMPISYDSSQLLKCTVSFTYDRYLTENKKGIDTSATTSTQQPGFGVPVNQTLTDQQIAASYNTNLNLNIAPNQFNLQPTTPLPNITTNQGDVIPLPSNLA